MTAEAWLIVIGMVFAKFKDQRRGVCRAYFILLMKGAF